MGDNLDQATLPESTVDGQADEAPTGTLDPTAETFIVSIGGVDEEVTLDELLKGHMRQADYTRKTQEAAQIRKEAEQALQLADALARDPRRTLTALADAYGVPIASAEDTDPDWDDPQAKLIRELQSEIAQLKGAQQQTAVEREISSLTTKYGEDVDVEAVMRHAVQGRFPSLEAAYKDLRFDEIQGTAKVLTRKQLADDVVVRAKRVAQVVNPGSTPAGEVQQVVEVPKDRKLTLDEAWALAKEGKRVPSWEEQFLRR